MSEKCDLWTPRDNDFGGLCSKSRCDCCRECITDYCKQRVCDTAPDVLIRSLRDDKARLERDCDELAAQVAQMRDVLLPILNEIEQRGQLTYPSCVTSMFEGRYGDAIRTALAATGEDYHNPADLERIRELEGEIKRYELVVSNLLK